MKVTIGIDRTAEDPRRLMASDAWLSICRQVLERMRGSGTAGR